MLEISLLLPLLLILCRPGTSFDLKTFKWDQHLKNPNSPQIWDPMSSNFEGNSIGVPDFKREKEIFEKVKKKDEDLKSFSDARCISYPGKTVCQIGNYGFVINGNADNLDRETLERFAAMVYHRMQKDESDFSIGIYPNKEVYSYVDKKLPMSDMEPVLVECRPIVEAARPVTEVVKYQCEWKPGVKDNTNVESHAGRSVIIKKRNTGRFGRQLKRRQADGEGPTTPQDDSHGGSVTQGSGGGSVFRGGPFGSPILRNLTDVRDHKVESGLCPVEGNQKDRGACSETGCVTLACHQTVPAGPTATMRARRQVKCESCPLVKHRTRSGRHRLRGLARAAGYKGRVPRQDCTQCTEPPLCCPPQRPSCCPPRPPKLACPNCPPSPCCLPAPRTDCTTCRGKRANGGSCCPTLCTTRCTTCPTSRCTTCRTTCPTACCPPITTPCPIPCPPKPCCPLKAPLIENTNSTSL